ncbi:hypothetical protein BX600DRAFT_67178 [Xylariales sp. PMI_506]|nr:hypothetical protein BX600DRAFT_67178 [Xylariales sp. PMI_506]
MVTVENTGRAAGRTESDLQRDQAGNSETTGIRLPVPTTNAEWQKLLRRRCALDTQHFILSDLFPSCRRKHETYRQGARGGQPPLPSPGSPGLRASARPAEEGFFFADGGGGDQRVVCCLHAPTTTECGVTHSSLHYRLPIIGGFNMGILS